MSSHEPNAQGLFPRPVVPLPSYSFTLHSQQFPTTPHRGDQLDAENEQLRQTSREIIDWTAGVIGDDGALNPRIVEPFNLSQATHALIASGWNPRGAWAPGTAYRAGDFVNYPGTTGDGYIASSDHTSSADFPNDFNAGLWTTLFTVPSPTRRTIVVSGVNYPDRNKIAYSGAFLGADNPTNDSTDITLNFGTTATQPAAGNHLHEGVYSPVGHGHMVFDQDTSGFVPAPGAGTNTRVLLADGTFKELMLTGGLPVGASIPFTGAATEIPSGWLLEDGSAYNRADWPELADLYQRSGWPFGAGDGSTTFNVEDKRERAVAGTGQGQDTDQGSPGLNRQLGDRDGTNTHLLTSAQSGVPPHSHPFQRRATSSNMANADKPTGDDSLQSATTSLNTAQDAAEAHSVLGPRVFNHYIVKASTTAAGGNQVLGEINSGSNLGAGVGLYAGKSAEALQFYSLKSSDGSVIVELDAANFEVDLRSLGGGPGGTGTLQDVLLGGNLVLADAVELDFVGNVDVTDSGSGRALVNVLPSPDGTLKDVTDGTVTVPGAQVLTVSAGGATSVSVNDLGGGLAELLISSTSGAGITKGSPYTVGNILFAEDDSGFGTAGSIPLTVSALLSLFSDENTSIALTEPVYDPRGVRGDVFNLDDIDIGTLDAARVDTSQAAWSNLSGPDAQSAFDSADALVPSATQKQALDAAAAPTDLNPFATIADLAIVAPDPNTLLSNTGATIAEDVNFRGTVASRVSGGIYAPSSTGATYVTLTGSNDTTLSNANCPPGFGVDFRIKVPASIGTINYIGWVQKNNRPPSGDAVVHLAQTDDVYEAWWSS